MSRLSRSLKGHVNRHGWSGNGLWAHLVPFVNCSEIVAENCDFFPIQSLFSALKKVQLELVNGAKVQKRMGLPYIFSLFDTMD